MSINFVFTLIHATACPNTWEIQNVAKSCIYSGVPNSQLFIK